MRKIINDPDNIVEEMMEGFIAAYHHMYYKHPEVNSVISRCRRKNKVSLIIGGGSGHEPMFSGFVGAGRCGECTKGAKGRPKRHRR